MHSSTELIGRLGQDPEGFDTKNGKGCRFSVATTSYGKGSGGGKGEEYTEWHRVVVFGKTAEFVLNYLSKGSLVFVSGRNQTSTYEKEGQKHYSTDVVAFRVLSLQKKQAEENSAPTTGASFTDDSDDVPF